LGNISVQRALVLLRYIIDQPDGLSIREVSRTLGYSPATVHKLIDTLDSQGYVTQDELTRRYHLGPQAVELGLTAISRMDVFRTARHPMELLCESSGETIFLAIPRPDHVVYIDKVVSPQPIRMDAQIGARRPYNCTSVGKALLAGFSLDHLKNLAHLGVFEKRTENSIIDVEDLVRELELVRERGWAYDNEEYIRGACCIGAPVFDLFANQVAAITISGPADRIKHNLDQFIPLVKECAADISKSMGFQGEAIHPGSSSKIQFKEE
jgi:DNA-binding IclR family transcriptional regulator